MAEIDRCAGRFWNYLIRGEEPLDDLDLEPRQLFHIYSVEYFSTTDHED